MPLAWQGSGQAGTFSEPRTSTPGGAAATSLSLWVAGGYNLRSLSLYGPVAFGATDLWSSNAGPHCRCIRAHRRRHCSRAPYRAC